MAWRSLTIDDVRSAMNGAELDALFAAAGDWTLSPDIANVLVNTASEIRGHIAAQPKNELGPDGTVPGGLVQTALAIVRFRILTSFPGLGDTVLTDDRRKEYDNAIDLLRRVANGQFSVAEPATGDIAVNPGISVVSAGSRRYTRDTLEGI